MSDTSTTTAAPLPSMEPVLPARPVPAFVIDLTNDYSFAEGLTPEGLLFGSNIVVKKEKEGAAPTVTDLVQSALPPDSAQHVIDLTNESLTPEFEGSDVTKKDKESPVPDVTQSTLPLDSVQQSSITGTDAMPFLVIVEKEEEDKKEEKRQEKKKRKEEKKRQRQSMDTLAQLEPEPKKAAQAQIKVPQLRAGHFFQQGDEVFVLGYNAEGVLEFKLATVQGRGSNLMYLIQFGENLPMACARADVVFPTN